MANVTITQLPNAGAITGTELVPVVQNGVTVHTTASALAGSPVQTQTFLTLNNEPTLNNSRSLGVSSGLSLTDGGAQGALTINLSGAVSNFNALGTGVVVKTGTSTLAARTFATSGLGLSITNGDGVAGNPTLQLTGIAAAIASSSGTGMLAIVGGSTIANRTLTGTADQIVVTDGNGAANPTISLSSNPIVPGLAGITVPVGASADRSVSAGVGTIRYSTTLNAFEGYTSVGWGIIVAGPAVTTFSAGTTGLTPNTPSTGPIVLGGTLLTTSGGTGLSSYTAGDLPYYASGTALSKLAIGTSGYILQSNGSAPVWVLASSVVGGAGGATTQVQYNNAGLLAGSANMTFNGTVLTSSFAGPVAATTLSASSTVSGTGFSTYLASPPAIGGTAAAAGTFTAIVGTSVTNSALTATRLVYSGTAGLEVDSANLTFNGTILTSTGFAGALNGTVGATTASTGAFTTLSTTGAVTITGGTANGVAYLNGSKVLTTGAALTFDGTNLGVGVVTPQGRIHSQITTPATGAVSTPIFYGGDGSKQFQLLQTGATYNTAGAGANELWYYTASYAALTFGSDGNIPIKWVSNGSEQMRLTSTGLGIGTNNFTAKLTLQSAGNTGLAIRQNTATDRFRLFVGDGTSSFAADENYITSLNTNLRFLNGVATTSELMQLTNAGILLIGATSATGTNKLQVSTDASIYGLTVGRGLGAVFTNTAVGASALAANTTGNLNTAVGRTALTGNTTGVENTALGANALQTNTTGGYNVAVGVYALVSNTTASDNTAVGWASVYTNTTGTSNVGIGNVTLYANTTGSSNTAVGHQGLRYNTTGANNTAIGTEALKANTTANYNTAIGYQAGISNTTGAFNFFGGAQVGYSNTTGNYNSFSGGQDATGYSAAFSNTTGTYNTAFGSGSLAKNTTASNNTAVGYQAGYSNTTGTPNVYLGYQAGRNATGSYAIYIGYQAGYSDADATNGSICIGYQAGYANTSGSGILAIGQAALAANTTGGFNTAIGRALIRNTTGNYNTAIGYEALPFAITADHNTAVGYQAGYATTGSQNVFLGYRAAVANTTGAQNTALGYSALQGATTGSYNVAVGFQTLFTGTTNANNVALGYQAGYSVTGSTNVYLGYQAGYSNAAANYSTMVGGQAGYSTTSGGYNTFLGQGAGFYVTTGAKNTILGMYTGNQGGLDIRTASNYIVLSDGDGNPRGTFDSSGNFGIGTTSPSTKLHVNTGAAGYGITVAASSQTSGTYQIGIDSNSALAFYETSSAVQRLVLSFSGNLGLGVTPSSLWFTGSKVINVGATGALWSNGSNNNCFSSNAIFQNASTTYVNTSQATQYQQFNGQHVWFNAPSGTAGTAITFTQAMTLDASGNLLVGTATANGILTLKGTSQASHLYTGAASAFFFGQFNSSGDVSINNAANAPILFATNNAERARIDASGNLLVGLTSNGSLPGDGYIFNKSACTQYIGHVVGTATGTGYLQFYYNGGSIGSITQSGTAAVLYNVTSDQRLKENIVDAPEFGSVIDSLQVRSFDWKTDHTHQRAGFVAQELVTVAPEAVHQPTNPEEMMAVDYSKLVPMLVKEIQSLRARVAQLESK